MMLNFISVNAASLISGLLEKHFYPPSLFAQLEVIFGLRVCLVICFRVFMGVELDAHRHFWMLHSNMLRSLPTDESDRKHRII